MVQKVLAAARSKNARRAEDSWKHMVFNITQNYDSLSADPKRQPQPQPLSAELQPLAAEIAAELVKQLPDLFAAPRVQRRVPREPKPPNPKQFRARDGSIIQVKGQKLLTFDL
jgi:hypothetical protein